MKFINAEEKHFDAIANLATSAEELFSFCATGSYPWDKAQIREIAQQRKNLTVAVEAEQVLAFSNLYNVIPGKCAFIGNVVVSNTYQGQGIGQQLIQHMIHTCQQQYQAVAHLSVFNFNVRAMLMYQKLGFRPYDLEQFINPQGETVALIHMRLIQPAISH